MERFSTTTGRITVDLTTPVAVSTPQSGILVDLHPDTNEASFKFRDGSTPDLVTGVIHPIQRSHHKTP